MLPHQRKRAYPRGDYSSSRAVYDDHHLYHKHSHAAATQPNPSQENLARQQHGLATTRAYFSQGASEAQPGINRGQTIAADPSVAALMLPRRPTLSIPPNGIGPVGELNDNDVLSGRGGRVNAHKGNVQFREIVSSRKKEYLAPTTKKLQKAHIAADVVRQIRNMHPSGRFLKLENDGKWWDIGDAMAIRKAGQALREDAAGTRNKNRGVEDQTKEPETRNDGSSRPKANQKMIRSEAPVTTNNAAPLTPSSKRPCKAVGSGNKKLPPREGATISGRGRGAKTNVSPRAIKVSSSFPEHQPEMYPPLIYQEFTPPPTSHQPYFIPPAPVSPVRRRGDEPQRDGRFDGDVRTPRDTGAIPYFYPPPTPPGWREFQQDGRFGGVPPRAEATAMPHEDYHYQEPAEPTKVAFGRPFHPPSS